jgi:uncharacterized protein (TIGR00369 family)
MTGTGPTTEPSEQTSPFVRAVGLHLVEISATRVTGWIDLGPQHHTPWGIVHGGVYTSAIETAATLGAAAAAAVGRQVAVGVTNTTDFLRPITGGRVEVTASPVQQGRTQQLWNVEITDAGGRLIAVGRVRLQNVDARR